MEKSYWNYIPIVLVLIIGFFLGGYLSFGIVFMDAFPSISNPYGRMILALYGMGVLGSSTYCSRFWSKDIYATVYKEPEFFPHLLDFVGYITLMLGGGITGVILFLIFKTGIGVSVNGQEEISLSKEASALIAYTGGLYHFKVQKQLEVIMEKAFKEHREKQKEKMANNTN